MLGRALFLAASLFAVQHAFATVSFPFVDHLPYALGNLGSVGGAGNWSGSSSAITVVTNSLDGTSLGAPASSGNMAAMTSSTGGTYNLFASASGDITSGRVYCSFLLKVTDTNSVSPTGEQVISMNIQNGSSTRYASLHFRQVAGAVQIGISKNIGNPAYVTNGPGANLADGNVYWIIFSQEFVTNGISDDLVKLWVNPAALGGAEDSNPSLIAPSAPDITTSTGMGRLYFNGGVVSYVDEIRMGTNWSDVAPGDGTPAPTPVPVITDAQLLPQGIALRGTNGPNNGVYQVLGTTNVTLPLTNWPWIAAHTFDAAGNFDSTNPVAPGLPQQFFRLLVGGTLPTAPSITNQPQGLTLAAGQNANFVVGASGTAPLDYFWSFNTNTPVGANTSTLSLVGVTSNDAGAYRVIVSNSLGTATSSVATLTVLIPPAITSDPTNLTIAAGSNATFNVTATGSEPLRYQWFFNTNIALANATNASFALGSAHATNAGAYSVVVTNAVGAATSAVATLTVLAPPSITTQPQSQGVTDSNPATFTVTAAGTAPLTYRWRFNTNTPVGVNSNVFTLLSAQTNDAGTYSVIVTNIYGAATSSVATLTVNPPSATPDFSLVGFAALDGFASNNTLQVGGTTGGAAGPLVVASNLASLKAYLESTNVYRVLIVSNIDLSSLSNHSGGFPAGYPTGEILVRSHKTIYSTNGATISRGTLRLGKASLGPQKNVIIRNLKFRDLWVYDSSGNYDTYGWDYVHLEEGSHHVWVDHCDFEQVYDGMVDVVHASDYVTVSWNIFRTQKKCSLIGHSDSNAAEDMGHLNVTYHHNYFVDVDERMPRMRFGNAHVFNTYCENLGGNGIQSTCSAATLVENSHWQFPQSGSLPTREENGGPTGIVKVVSCVISNLPGVNVQFRQYGQSNFLFNAPFVSATPPYSYTNVMHPVGQVPGIVTNWAGVGKLTSF